MTSYLDVKAVWRLMLTSTKGATERAREAVAVLLEQRALSTLICFIILPFQPFTLSLAVFFFVFFPFLLPL